MIRKNQFDVNFLLSTIKQNLCFYVNNVQGVKTLKDLIISKGLSNSYSFINNDHSRPVQMAENDDLGQNVQGRL